MFWSWQRGKRAHKRVSRARHHSARRLLVEPLECRRVLNGTVDVWVGTLPLPAGAPPTLGAGELNLYGDGLSNLIEISQPAGYAVGQYLISGTSNTLLRVNGVGLQTSSVTVYGVVGDIESFLGDGNDELTVLNAQLPAGSNLEIENGNGTKTNVLSEVVVQSTLTVTLPAGGATGVQNLEIRDSTVQGLSTVTNWIAAPPTVGETTTTIQDSDLQGGLIIANPDGANIVHVINSEIGKAAGAPVTTITNTNGPSLVTFAGSIVYTQLAITNGVNPFGFPAPQPPPPAPGLGTYDILTFSSTNVWGATAVVNNDGDTMFAASADTEFGSSLIPIAWGGVGGPLTVNSGVGYDVFLMLDSTAQYGVAIDTDGPPAGAYPQVFGSLTEIEDSFIGTHPAGAVLPSVAAAVPLPGGFPAIFAGPAAFTFDGDTGNDKITIDNTTIAGGTAFMLTDNGNDSVFLVNATITVALAIRTDGGNDDVHFDEATEVGIGSVIRLGAGVDVLEVISSSVLGLAPGAIYVDGGAGISDDLITDATVIPPPVPWSIDDFEV